MDEPAWSSSRGVSGQSPSRQVDGRGGSELVLRVRAQRDAAREKPGSGTTGTVPYRVTSADGRRFETVSQALQAAGDGDRLTLDPGVYEEDLVLDRPVTIAAADGAAQVRLTFPALVRISAATRFEGVTLSTSAAA